MQWLPSLEPCDLCGGYIEIYTAQNRLVITPSVADVGNIARCTLNDCGGIVAHSGDIEWSNRSYDALAQRLIPMVRR